MNLVVKEYQKVTYSVGTKTSLQSSYRLAFLFFKHLELILVSHGICVYIDFMKTYVLLFLKD